MHTSTVVVSVRPVDRRESTFRESDVRVEYFSGTGAGGQHRNKKQCSVRAVHVPSGTQVVRQGRSREDNYREAVAALRAAVESEERSRSSREAAATMKSDFGSGMRGDKVRTYRYGDDRVVDHRTGKSARASDAMRGKFSALW